MITKSLKTRDSVLIDWSKADGCAIITLDLLEEFKQEEWIEKVSNCQAVFHETTGKLVVRCEMKPESNLDCASLEDKLIGEEGQILDELSQSWVV